jgi:hypothetical protein
MITPNTHATTAVTARRFILTSWSRMRVANPITLN